MRTLPPADRKSAAEVGYKGSDEGVSNEVTGYAAMPGVMSNEHDLLLDRH